MEMNNLRHVVTFDGARKVAAGRELVLSCAGSAEDCGCADVTGTISGPGGSSRGCGSAIHGAENASTSAGFYFTECRVQAQVVLETIREGGETTVKGGGTVVFSGGGRILLPTSVEASTKISDGAEVVCAQWTAMFMAAVTVSSGGVLWFAGSSMD